MSGVGAPKLAVQDAAGVTVGLVASQWHDRVMDGLLGGARRALTEMGATIVEVRVPGAFELPVACARLAEHVDALVALGVVIRGGTPHFDYVCEAATTGLTQVCVRTGVPIGFGVLTCDSEDQALARAGLPESTEDKGYEAAQAAVVTYLTLQKTISALALGEAIPDV